MHRIKCFSHWHENIQILRDNWYQKVAVKLKKSKPRDKILFRIKSKGSFSSRKSSSSRLGGGRQGSGRKLSSTGGSRKRNSASSSDLHNRKPFVATTRRNSYFGSSNGVMNVDVSDAEDLDTIAEEVVTINQMSEIDDLLLLSPSDSSSNGAMAGTSDVRLTY